MTPGTHMNRPFASQQDKAMMLDDISGVRIPDSKLAREMTQFIRDTESDLLFHHSVRVYCWAALTGQRTG
jgi:hypothetical protein